MPEGNTELRKELTRLLLYNKGMNEIDGKGDIKKIIDTNEFPKDTDCSSILFGEIDTAYILNHCLAMSEVIENPEPWAIADYGYSEDRDGVSHIGIIGPNLKLISKWGYKGHVFESSPENVPSWYGPVVFRRMNNPDLLKGMHPKLKAYLDTLGWQKFLNQKKHLRK